MLLANFGPCWLKSIDNYKRAFPLCDLFVSIQLKFSMISISFCNFLNENKKKKISTGYVDVRSEDEVPIFRRQKVNFR